VPTDLDALLRDAKKVNIERHNVIHALWVRDMEGDVIRIRLGKVLSADVNTVSDLAARVRRIRDQINGYPWAQPTRIAIPLPHAGLAENKMAKRSISRSVRCEVRGADGRWDQVSVAEALALGNAVEKRCIECHGPVRAHASHGGPSAHIEHRQAHAGCSLGDSFNGHRSMHPHAVQ
jgi:hypothetical protein